MNISAYAGQRRPRAEDVEDRASQDLRRPRLDVAIASEDEPCSSASSAGGGAVPSQGPTTTRLNGRCQPANTVLLHQIYAASARVKNETAAAVAARQAALHGARVASDKAHDQAEAARAAANAAEEAVRQALREAEAKKQALEKVESAKDGADHATRAAEAALQAAQLATS